MFSCRRAASYAQRHALRRGNELISPSAHDGASGPPFQSVAFGGERETLGDLRPYFAASDRLDYHGQIYDLPLPGGEGRAIRSLLPPTHLPIYVASLGPANLRLTGELADGLIGTSFFPETADVFLDPIREGAARVFDIRQPPDPRRCPIECVRRCAGP